MINLFEIARRLSAEDVKFVIVGGVAIRGHGGNYVTEDLDICYQRANENLKKIAGVLAPLNPRPRNFPPELPYIFEWTTLRNGTNFTFETDMGDVDLLAEVKGIGDYEDVVENALQIDLDGHTTHILSVRALIIAKRAAGRPKDEAGLKVLEALNEANRPDD